MRGAKFLRVRPALFAGKLDWFVSGHKFPVLLIGINANTAPRLPNTKPDVSIFKTPEFIAIPQNTEKLAAQNVL